MQAITMERGRFFFDGVGKAIVANVAHREQGSLVLEQPLPFLRLDTTVRDELGGWARLSRVDIALDGDVPRLVIELARDPQETPSAPAIVTRTAESASGREDTMQTFTPGVSSRPARTDSTVPYDFHPQDRPSGEVVVAPPPRLPIVRRPSLWARAIAWLGSLVRRPAIA